MQKISNLDSEHNCIVKNKELYAQNKVRQVDVYTPHYTRNTKYIANNVYDLFPELNICYTNDIKHHELGNYENDEYSTKGYLVYVHELVDLSKVSSRNPVWILLSVVTRYGPVVTAAYHGNVINRFIFSRKKFRFFVKDCKIRRRINSRPLNLQEQTINNFYTTPTQYNPYYEIGGVALHDVKQIALDYGADGAQQTFFA